MWVLMSVRILPITMGAGIMVYDFITHHGFLEECELVTLVPGTSWMFLEYGVNKEGYWTGDRCIANVQDVAALGQLQISQRTVYYIVVILI